MATIRTIYEVRKPAEQFYSVSRTGYTDVGNVVISAVDSILSQGAMTVANVVFLDSTVTSNPNGSTTPNPSTGWSTWPPNERLYTLVNPGIGYKVGDRIEVANATEANISQTRFTVNIVAVSSNGSIRSFHMIKNAPMANLAVIPTTHVNSGTLAWISNTATATTIASVSNSVGVSNLTPPAKDPTPTGVTDWQGFWGADGSGGSQGTRWPTTGIVVPKNLDIKVGQLVSLNTAQTTLSSNATIAANTRITSIQPISVVNGLIFVRGIGYIEGTGDYYSLVLSNPITINKNDSLIFRGTDATFENFSKQVTPDNFRVTLESTGAVDPLSDQIGVFGNIVATTTNSNVVQITNLTIPGNPWTPRIYAGQGITSVNSVTGTITSPLAVVSVAPAVVAAGSFVNGRSYVIKTVGNTSFTGIGASANTVGTTFIATGAGSGTGTATDNSISNVSLSRTHSFTVANEGLKFSFDELQPWRLCFDVEKNTTRPTAGPQSVVVYAATEIQLPDNGSFTNIYNALGTTIIDRAGIMGNVPTGPNGTINSAEPDEGFLNRTARTNVTPGVYPLNYMLTLTNRGMFFGMWEGNWSTLQKPMAQMAVDKDNYFNWFLIQRPVNRVTGQVLTTGNAPVFCVNSVGYKYWKFIVRESDAPHPTTGAFDCKSYTIANTPTVAGQFIIGQSYTIQSVGSTNFTSIGASSSAVGVIFTATGVGSGTGTATLNNILGNANLSIQTTPYRVPADAHSTDSFAVLNTSNQVSLTEDSKYLISFLTNLTTPRFRYSEELDMIGQTSADVCGAGLDVSITAYQESGPRKYRALPANGPYNSGLRICVLKDIP